MAIDEAIKYMCVKVIDMHLLIQKHKSKSDKQTCFVSHAMHLSSTICQFVIFKNTDKSCMLNIDHMKKVN